MADIILSKPAQYIDQGCSVVSSNMHINGQEFRIYYKVSDGPVSHTSDAFLAAGLFPAMKEGVDLKIEGTVSPKLPHAIHTIQDIVTSWFPGYTSISIETQVSNHTQATEQRGVGVFFSGGIDSFYTLLKHRDEITTLIFMHGFDIQLDKYEFRIRASKSVKEVATGFGKAFLEVETNLPEWLEKLSPRFIPAGGDAHGAVLASIALLLSPQLKKIYIPSSYTYNNLNPWGSHPMLDPLWSSEDMEIVHDGCEATRVKKAAVVAQSEIAMENLRVCFFKPEGAINCEKCEKCLRSKANLRAVGALDRCTTFKQDLDLEALAQVEISKEQQYQCYQDTLKVVEMNGNDPELANALHECVKNYEYNKLAKKLNDEMIPFFESFIGQKLLKNRRNTIIKYLWHADPEWMIKEVSKESLKLADRKMFGGLINKLRNVRE